MQIPTVFIDQIHSNRVSAALRKEIELLHLLTRSLRACSTATCRKLSSFRITCATGPQIAQE